MNFFDSDYMVRFLATLVPLHSTLVSHSVGWLSYELAKLRGLQACF